MTLSRNIEPCLGLVSSFAGSSSGAVVFRLTDLLGLWPVELGVALFLFDTDDVGAVNCFLEPTLLGFLAVSSGARC